MIFLLHFYFQVIWIIRFKVMAPNKSGLLAPVHGSNLKSENCLKIHRKKVETIISVIRESFVHIPKSRDQDDPM